MKTLSNFRPALEAFIQEECRLDASRILEEKDPPKSSFSLDTLRAFSYNTQLQKFRATNPLLVASIVGTLSQNKGAQCEDLSRKGFGGPNKGEDVDLVPTIVQTLSRLLKNRHPRSISILPSMNSLNLWAYHVPGHVFHFFNSLGDCYRCKLCLVCQTKVRHIKIVFAKFEPTKNSGIFH